MLSKKQNIIGDVRDESAEDIRIVLEPKTRTIEAEMMMEFLFKETDLETRIPLNLMSSISVAIPACIALRRP